MNSIKIYDKNGKHTHGVTNVTSSEAMAWLEAELSKDIVCGRYNHARWLPDFLEGAETRQVLVTEAIEAHEETRIIYDDNMNEIGSEVIMVPATSAQYNTEYLHPVEYSYQIIEEDIAVIKARKLAELSAESIAQNNELKAWNEYRASNILAGVYDEAKTQIYISAYKAKSELLRNKYYELKAIVESCTTEEEISNIQFVLE